jgi:drug/metabolite transporter (DMT)-like permease
MRLQTLLGLILCNLIWSANPAMGKIILTDISPELAAWCRYASALLAYLLFAALWLRKIPEPKFIRPSKAVLLIGFSGFCLAPLLQMTGLNSSTATDNALIVAMEPLFTVFAAWIFLGEGVSNILLVSFFVALFGFVLLTGFVPGQFGGNMLILISLAGEACYSVTGRKLLEKHRPIGIFGSALIAGVVFLTIALTLKGGPGIFVGLGHLTWRSSLAILWLGPIGTAFAYFYWLTALTEAPVASLALTLFIQPVCGSIWGYFFLGERLSALQAVGGGLILAAVSFQSLPLGAQLLRRPAKANSSNL